MLLFQNPGDKDFDGLVAENEFITEIHLLIEQSLEELCLSQADLAKAVGVSEARISQILSGNGRNLQARTIARIAHALGMTAAVDFVRPDQVRPTREVHAVADMPTEAWLQGVHLVPYWERISVANDCWESKPSPCDGQERLFALA